MERIEKLVEKYRGYILDPEGNAVEIMEMLFIREKIQDFLENPNKIAGVSPKLHRIVMELDDQLWHNIDNYLEIIGEFELKTARSKLGTPPRFHWWWYLDDLVPRKAISAG